MEGSRVARMLRDARAAVAAPMRPETPRDPIPPRPVRLQLLRRDSEQAAATGLTAVVEVIRLRCDWDSVETAAVHLEKLLTSGEADANELRKCNAIDALVQALNVEAPNSCTLAVLAAIRSCEFIPEFTQLAFTSGIFPMIKTLLSSKSVAVVGSAMILLKLLSGEFAHAFFKFGITPTLIDTLNSWKSSEVAIAMGASTLSLAVDRSPDVLAQLRDASAMCLLIDLSCDSTQYVQSHCIYTLFRIIDNEPVSLVQNLWRKRPTFITELISILTSRCTSGSATSYKFDVSSARLFTVLTTHEKFARKFGPAVIDGFVALLSETALGSQAVTLLLVSITNLTYFGVGFGSSDIENNLMHSLLGLMFGDELEHVVEATRALGNITASPPGVELCLRYRVQDVLAILAGHEDERIAFNSVGALINLSATVDVREAALAALEAVEGSQNSEIRTLVDQLQFNIAQ